MLSKLKELWGGQVEVTPAVRIPKSGGLTPADIDEVPVIVPTRFASPAARERFCAAILQAQQSNHQP